MQHWIKVTLQDGAEALVDLNKVRVMTPDKGGGSRLVHEKGDTTQVQEGVEFFRPLVEGVVAQEAQEAVAAPTPEPSTIHVGHNMRYFIDGDTLHILADVGPDAREAAKMTHGRKNYLIASSKGNPPVEGSPIPGLRIALNLYTPVEDSAD